MNLCNINISSVRFFFLPLWFGYSCILLLQENTARRSKDRCAQIRENNDDVAGRLVSCKPNYLTLFIFYFYFSRIYACRAHQKMAIAAGEPSTPGR